MASACELRRTSLDERFAGSESYDVVDWDGPEDDANPLYWGTPEKVLNVACVSILNFLTYVLEQSIDGLPVYKTDRRL